MKAYAYFQQCNGDVKAVAEITIPKGMLEEQAALDNSSKRRSATVTPGQMAILEHVYCLLQNIRGSWSFGPKFEGTDIEGQLNLDYSPNVKFIGEHDQHEGRKIGERSMMVGDLVTLDGKVYEVAMFGFEEYKE